MTTTAANARQGALDTSTLVTNARPENWRAALPMLNPAGDTVLTGLTAKMKKRSTDDPHFHWWNENPGRRSGKVAGVYTDAALSSAYTSGGAAGDTLYVKFHSTQEDSTETAASVAKAFRPGHDVILRDQSDYKVDVLAHVLSVVVNGTSSYLQVRLLEADDNSSAGNLSDCDKVLIAGNANPEFGQMPNSISYDPIERDNYTQIFRTPLELSRTMRNTKVRYGSSEYQRLKRQALVSHGIEMEMAFLFGRKLTGTGSNGKPIRRTQGVVTAAMEFAPDNCSDFLVDGTGTWLSGGHEWFKAKMENVFRYGTSERLALGGMTALTALNNLVETYSEYTVDHTKKRWGLQVSEFVTPHGVIMFKRHPLFNHEQSYNRSMVLLEPTNLTYVYLQNSDTQFIDDANGRNSGTLDGTMEEYLTECGLEFDHPATMGALHNLGLDN